MYQDDVRKRRCFYLACASVAVLEGFGEMVGFDDVGTIQVGDGSG